MVRQAIEQRVHAREAVEDMFLQLLEHGIQVTRVGQQDILAPYLGAQHHVHGKGEDVVQRQRTDKTDLVVQLATRQARLVPGLALQHVGQDVAMQQHGSLGHTGGAAGVLQRRQVIRPRRHLAQCRRSVARHGLVEAHGRGQLVGRHHLLDLAHHEVDQGSLETAHAVPHGGQHDVTHIGLRQTLLQRVGKVLDDEDRLGTGVLELVLQFACRVKRVDVDQHQPGTQDGGHGNRILQDVGHHHRHAIARLHARQLLQIGGQRTAGAIQLGIRHVAAHHGVGRLVGVTHKTLVQQLYQRTVAVQVHIGGNAFRILLEPGSAVGECTHVSCPLCSMCRVLSIRSWRHL